LCLNVKNKSAINLECADIDYNAVVRNNAFASTRNCWQLFDASLTGASLISRVIMIL